MLLGCKAYRRCQMQNQNQKPSLHSKAEAKTKSQVLL